MGWWTRSSRLILVATVIPPSTSWAGCGGQVNPTDAPTATDGAARRGDGGNGGNDAATVTHGSDGGTDADNVADGTAPGDDGGDAIQITWSTVNPAIATVSNAAGSKGLVKGGERRYHRSRCHLRRSGRHVQRDPTVGSGFGGLAVDGTGAWQLVVRIA